MNREIKFRAWNKKEKRMWSQEDLEVGNYALGSHGKIVAHERNSEPLWNVDHIFEPLLFTGRKDKNGKDVYEGDVCRGNWPYAKLCVVRWVDKRGSFMFSGVAGEGLGDRGSSSSDPEGYKLNAVSVEVVGNIYENPELLKI